jgi:hypothetical protein
LMMPARVVLVFASLLAALPAAAGELGPFEAIRFVAGRAFAFTCSDATNGVGRIEADGSVTGSIRIRGAGPPKHVVLPAGTLQVKPHAVCASIKGLAFRPCFKVDQTSAHSFRGSVAGFDFAYCDFVGQGEGRSHVARAAAPASAAIAGE